MQTIDLGGLAKFLLPVAVAIFVGIYLIARRMVLAYLRLQDQVRVQEQALKMRQGQGKDGAKQGASFVRKTDIFEQLSPQQKLIHQQAELFESQKKFREASQLYESINFQRKAIDLLEFNGFIDDAAQMLIRMKVPFRAAVVYERNNQFIKAAECFLMDKKPDSAARAYEKAAVRDYHLYLKAGECFQAAGMIDQCLDTYSKILRTQEIFKMAQGSQKLDFLATYMADPFVAKEILEAMTLDQAKALVSGLNLRPSWVQSMSLWVHYKSDLNFFHTALDLLVEKDDLADLFWSHITLPFMNHIGQLLSKHPASMSRRVYEYHAKILHKRNQQSLAQLFSQNAQMIPPV